jgi:hypothetical protein
MGQERGIGMSMRESRDESSQNGCDKATDMRRLSRHPP